MKVGDTILFEGENGNRTGVVEKIIEFKSNLYEVDKELDTYDIYNNENNYKTGVYVKEHGLIPISLIIGIQWQNNHTANK
ncbi:MAG: hypothetical protein ACRC0V_05165 [Fusobacteriaceae bacterium]